MVGSLDFTQVSHQTEASSWERPNEMSLRLLWGENLLGSSLEVSLMEEERRRKKMGSGVREERVSAGSR